MTRWRLAALVGVLALIAYLGTTSTISTFIARITNTTNTISSAGPSCHSVPLADGATRLYPLNEQTGLSATDESSTNATGTYQGGRQSVSQTPYPCVRDNDWYSRVDQTHWVSTPGTISIAPGSSTSQEAWFRTVNSQGVISAFGSTQTGQSTNKTNLITITSNGHLAFLVQGSSTTYEVVNTYAVNDGAWHNVIAVHDASYGVKVYLDGALLMQQSSAHPAALTGYLRIGYENTNGFTNGFGTDQSLAHFWDNLAFISFYPFALSATQATQHYQAGR
ncbi:LamG-like jellyroll fold domain-containing protein [Actinokineospora inagensis]|uniref:LamG-like jellyroll fold domain-containing protein n=1 Tax=Actinokineospora inagensis TaxID=103730 RepID=UPI0003FFC4D9|nr:LamG-like jellyroll fold domain-containing protein [Actinokineospora inagensis]